MNHTLLFDSRGASQGAVVTASKQLSAAAVEAAAPKLALSASARFGAAVAVLEESDASGDTLLLVGAPGMYDGRGAVLLVALSATNGKEERESVCADERGTVSRHVAACTSCIVLIAFANPLTPCRRLKRVRFLLPRFFTSLLRHLFCWLFPPWQTQGKHQQSNFFRRPSSTLTKSTRLSL